MLGSGIEMRRLLLPDAIKSEWEALALKQNQHLMDMLLDPFFYYKLKNKNYNSLEEVPCEKCSGILNENKNKLEIWFKNKKIFKTNTVEIMNEMLLFPLFNLQPATNAFTTQKGIYIINKEMGNLGVFEMQVQDEKLTLNDFVIKTEHYQESKIITKITYKNQQFKQVKKETLIIHQSSFEVK